MFAMANQDRNTSQATRAVLDPQLLRDPRVLWNLLAHERRQIEESASHHYLQEEITLEMRRLLADWLSEVCDHEHCEEGVFPLAMSYIRKCLSLFPVEKTLLQLLGTACVLLASKMRDVVPLTVDMLAYYTAFSVSCHQILEGEIFAIDQLRWNLQIIIPHDFLDHILERLSLSYERRALLRECSQIFVTRCSLDNLQQMFQRLDVDLDFMLTENCNLSIYAPSMIAAACVANTMFSLGMLHHPAEEMIMYLAAMIQANSAELQNCRLVIENTLPDDM